MAKEQEIILASTSPSRKKLLRMLGFKFKVAASGYQEDNHLSVTPHQLVRTMSRGKARAVARKHKAAIVIAADTIAMLDRKVFGKPANASEARKMLRTLSGRCHLSITGFTIIDTTSGREVTKSVQTKVCFKKLTAREIEAYITSKQPFGKAAAYSLQGLGVAIVNKVEGEPFTMAGFPMFALSTWLKKFGVEIFTARPRKKPRRLQRITSLELL